MPKLFGTDGVRGVANEKLSPELALLLARAHAHCLRKTQARPRVAIGRDTRLSSPMLEAAYAAGLMSGGVDVDLLGIIPTPGVAFLTRQLGLQGGVMISASHNPIADNGIKLFGPDGFKLDDEASHCIEELMDTSEVLERPTGVGVGQSRQLPEGAKAYLDHLLRAAPRALAGLKVILDCAYGAAYQLAPEVFRKLGAQVIALHAQDDGSKINVNCGSTDLKLLKQTVLQEKADLGLAFDGDADRCLAVDERGQEVDGDRMLLVFAEWLREQGKLPGDTVVATVMSNYGLEKAMREGGFQMLRAAVGDRYVLETMQQKGARLGGEQSGHIIFLDYCTTGDGVLSGVMLAGRKVQQGIPASALTDRITPLPQILVNIHAPHKERLSGDSEIARAVSQEEKRLEGRGRVLVRPSGTEPLVRVMAEGPDEGELREVLESLSELIKQRLGS